MVAVQGKDLTVLKALASESNPVSDGWIARVAWKRKSHLDQKLKLVRRILRVLRRAKLVDYVERFERAYYKGQGFVLERSGFGWEITDAGATLVE
jgi:hypothetical protein